MPWIALLVALAALGLGLWLLLRKPKAAMTSPSSGGTVAKSAKSVSNPPGSPDSGAVSLFDLREMSYFPRGIVDPVRESVNRVMARIGDVATKGYARDKTNIDRQLKVALDKYEKEAAGYANIAALM